MLVAEELDLPLDKVGSPSRRRRPELVFNQLTGGSNTTISTYTPIRVAAAVARAALLDAAAIVLGDTVASLIAKGGVDHRPRRLLGDVRRAGRRAPPAPPPRRRGPAQGGGRLRGHRHAQQPGRRARRGDRRGRTSRPTSRSRAPCRPWCAARPRSTAPRCAVRNQAAVRRMPGVTDVAQVDRRRRARHGPSASASTRSGRSTSTGARPGRGGARRDGPAQAALGRAAAAGAARPLAKTVDADFTFYFRSNAALETNSRHRGRPRRPRRGLGRAEVADRRAGADRQLAGPRRRPGQGPRGHRRRLLRPQAVLRRGARGRGDLQGDGQAGEADVAPRGRRPGQGRAHPMATSRVRATAPARSLTFEQQHTSVETDFRHGLGEMLTAEAADLPAGSATSASPRRSSRSPRSSPTTSA